MQYPLLPAALVGILAIMVGLSVQQPLKDRQFVTPPHFHNKMLALEFIPDSLALQQFFGEGTEVQTGNMEAMRSALRRDNFFALAYTLFLMVFGIVCWSATRKAWYWLVLPLALLAGLSDFIENAQTLRMLDNIQSEDIHIAIQRLHFWVWTKSLSMAVLLLVAANFLWQSGWVGRILALLAFAAAIAGFLSFFWIGLFETYSLLGLTIFFPLLVLYCVFYQPKRQAAA